MKEELIVHHYHHHPRPRKKKPEPFWKGMGKLAMKEAASIGNLAVNETLDISDRVLRTAMLAEPPKSKRR